MTRPGSDAELHPVVVSEFPASLLSTKCAEVIFCFVLEVGHLQGLPPSWAGGGRVSRTGALTALLLFWKERKTMLGSGRILEAALQFCSADRHNEMENPNNQNEYIRARSLTAWWQAAHEMIILWQISISEAKSRKGLAGWSWGPSLTSLVNSSGGRVWTTSWLGKGASSLCFAVYLEEPCSSVTCFIIFMILRTILPQGQRR